MSPGLMPGSSPLARGTPGTYTRGECGAGLIPARAGNTPSRSTQPSWPGAHPRSRGEHSPGISGIMPRPGSSPLARGTHITGLFASCALGLIPARAGNTAMMLSPCLICWAHPRSRGEHVRYEMLKVQQPGSSPLARGTQSFIRTRQSIEGLIPARAGNTLHSHPMLRQWGAHPRSRGEHTC